MTTSRPRLAPLALSILFGICALLLVISIVKSPGEAFRASLAGLQMWWQLVFPGLLPPLMLAELLAASGLLHGFAVLAEPLTRGLFRLPGAAGWAIAFGWSSGVPAGARETARLREQGLIGDREAGTLLILSHVPNPFLVIVVVGSGFLQAPVYGWAIVTGLWLSAACAGLIWSWLSGQGGTPPESAPSGLRALVGRSLRAMRDARTLETRPFGKQMADAVTHAASALFTIGGLILMSAVTIRMLQLLLPGNDTWLTIPGLYEMHLGAYDVSRSPLFEAAPASAAALIAAILAWSGLSGLLQARASYSTAPFPWGSFLTGRLLHGALAVIITYPLALAASKHGFAPLAPAWIRLGGVSNDDPSTTVMQPSFWNWNLLAESTLAALACLGTFLLLALLSALIRPRSPKSTPPEPILPDGKPLPPSI